MRPRISAVLSMALAAGTMLVPARMDAQLRHRARRDTVPDVPPAHRALNLTVDGVGVSIGNSARVTGVRINAVDHDVRRVNGVNLTLWISKRNPRFEMDGVALGLVAPRARDLNGAAAGLVGVVAEREMNGIAAGGVGVISQGDVNGIATGGLAVIARQHLRGIGAAGLAVVGDRGVDGIATAGFATLAEGDVRGATAAGLANLTEGHLTGVSLAGVFDYVDGAVTGIDGAAIVTRTKGPARGINWAGVVLVGQDVAGLNAGGAAVFARRARGITLSGLYTRADNFGGLGVSAVNDVRGMQRGITIALYNYARDIRGVQLGVLNYVRSNPRGLKLLPLFNTKF